MSSSKCVRLTSQKKYRERPSPPYAARDCRGQVLEGNDGRLYESRPNVNGVYAWRLVNKSTRKVTQRKSTAAENVMRSVMNAAKINLPRWFAEQDVAANTRAKINPVPPPPNTNTRVNNAAKIPPPPNARVRNNSSSSRAPPQQNNKSVNGIRKTFGSLFTYRTILTPPVTPAPGSEEVKYGGVILLRDLGVFKAGQTFRVVTLDLEDGTLRADQARRRLPLIA
jgi:hypothetical protein